MTRFWISSIALVFAAAVPASAAEPVADLADKVNQKVVKLFGSGGFRGVNSYGTGIIISPEGHILTAATQMLDTSELIVHLADGTRRRAAVLVLEPELDVALLKIFLDGKKPEDPTNLDLPYFDVAESAKRPLAQGGDWVIGFSNCFEIAMRDEPVSVQRGVIAAQTKLHGRRGVFDFPYSGDVYVLDAITNNPGAAGGPLTDRKGNLLGLIGREIRNTLTETWMNYAIPIGAKVDIKDGDKKITITIPEFVSLAMQGKYKPVNRTKEIAGPGGYTGIVFVPNVLERTPPYIEDVLPGTPATTAVPANAEDKVGLRVDDLVSFIDGEPIYSIKTYLDYLRKTRPGDKIRFEIRRGDKLLTYEITLGEHPRAPVPIPVPKG